jgi:uncharacterized membrane protein HdeD (DUF308 family)
MTTISSPDRLGGSIWWVFLLQGLAAIVFGLLLFTNPGATLLSVVTFLGFYWLAIGIMEIVRIFTDRSVPWLWSLLSGVLGIFAGLLVLRHPVLAAIVAPTLIVLVLGIEALVMGFVNVISSVSGGGVGSLLLGVANIVLGAILIGSPMATALAVSVVFGIVLLVEGVGLVVWAFRMRG